MKPTRMILADDHPVYRQGLRLIFDRADDFEIVAEAKDGEQALALVRAQTPDLILLDVTMPKLDGIAVARACRREGLPTRVVFLTMHQEEHLLDAALHLGVSGYVLKDSLASDILEAARAVVRGEEYVSAPLVQLLMKRARSPIRLHERAPGIKALTAAERRVLKQIASDRTSKEIAGNLGLSIRTVENHRARAAAKLGLRGAHSLVKFAFENKDLL